MPARPPPSRITGLRRFALVSTLGALLGFVAFCIFGPRLVGIWHAPLGQEAVVCGTQIETAMNGFVKLQLWAALAGALLLLGVVTSLRSFWAYLFHPRVNAPATAPVTPGVPDADTAPPHGATPPPATISPAGDAPLPPPAAPLLLSAPPAAGPPALVPPETRDPLKTPAK